MNQKNTKYLFTKFPFFHPEAGPRGSLMCFGFECDDGWFNLIKQLCEKLKSLNLKKFEITQVKEKYGGLRVYTGVIKPVKAAEKVWDLIDKAERKSYKVCENCGRAGKPNKYGWIKTFCRSCHAKQNK